MENIDGSVKLLVCLSMPDGKTKINTITWTFKSPIFSEPFSDYHLRAHPLFSNTSLLFLTDAHMKWT